MKRSPPLMRPKELDLQYQSVYVSTGIRIVSIWKDKGIFLYRTVEFHADPEFHGRAFRIERIRDDIDAESPSPHDADHYNVIIGEHPIYHRCDCPGFLQFNYCKHVIVMEDVLIDEMEQHGQEPATTH